MSTQRAPSDPIPPGSINKVKASVDVGELPPNSTALSADFLNTNGTVTLPDLDGDGDTLPSTQPPHNPFYDRKGGSGGSDRGAAPLT